MHGWSSDAACDHGAYCWSSCSGPSVSWCMWQDFGGPLLARPQHLPGLQGAHECWCQVSFLLDSVKEGRSFSLGHFLFLFAACRHPLHMHLQGFGFQGCKDISEVVLTVWCDAVEEEPVLQGMPKDGGVVGIFWVPVVDGQADGCSSSCQCAGKGISCGLSRLGDELLLGWFCGLVSDTGWSHNGQIRKQGEDTKMAVTWEPLVRFTSNLDRM